MEAAGNFSCITNSSISSFHIVIMPDIKGRMGPAVYMVKGEAEEICPGERVRQDGAGRQDSQEILAGETVDGAFLYPLYVPDEAVKQVEATGPFRQILQV